MKSAAWAVQSTAIMTTRTVGTPYKLSTNKAPVFV